MYFKLKKAYQKVHAEKANTYNEKVYYLNDEEFDVSEEMIRLFGEGYTSKEYQTMQRIYDDTKQDYPNISSNQKNLTSALCSLCCKRGNCNKLRYHC